MWRRTRYSAWNLGKRCLRYMLGIHYCKHGHVSSYGLYKNTTPEKLRWCCAVADSIVRTRMNAERLLCKMLPVRLDTKRCRCKSRKNSRQIIRADLKFTKRRFVSRRREISRWPALWFLRSEKWEVKINAVKKYRHSQNTSNVQKILDRAQPEVEPKAR